jgi:hypothetical protein
MTYASPAWEFSADMHLLKLQCLQNKVLRTTGKFPRCTSVRELHMSFQVPYIYDYITKLCRQYRENANVRDTGKANPDTEHISGSSLAAVKRTTIQVTRQPL